MREERSFADAVDAFYRLIGQPDLIWKDLLDGLGHRGLIAEQSTIRLHLALNVPVPPSGFIFDRAVWTKILEEKGIKEEISVKDGKVQPP
ncbi:MAG: hypothetical protein HZA50_08535 [Planctomycetes bacterium]|nr:hypothetical protein [Planctomycetota bacterium]